jgi:CubicO group peptidase (beta-lactamase class C family)
MNSTQDFMKLIFLSLGICFSIISTAQTLENKIDKYIASEYKEDAPGVSILVAKDGKAIYSKGFGMANLENKVSNSSNSVFEIGSITKQFTAVAILMLEEQGKLSVQDEITKYIPDYPTQGKTITIHHLLNHTSGIKSYTNMISFLDLARTDMTPTELIEKFKNEPMEFDPGTDFNYNNSGYILLGYIIEVASGKSYEAFIQENIFDKIGMSNSYYGSMIRVIPNRARGYAQNQDGYENARYLSMTLPYAAGSIMSTTQDLLKWQNAISSNKLIKRSSLEKAINGSKLTNGDSLDYGYGWISGKLRSSKTIEHSGGIFGYSSNGIFLPDENIYVIGLSNCECGDVNTLTKNIAAIAIGDPFFTKADAIQLSNEKLAKWVGAYEFDEGVIRHISIEESQLYSLREGSRTLKIYPISTSRFIFDGVDTEYNFYTKDGNRMVNMIINGQTITGKGIDKKAPVARQEIEMSIDLLQEYLGTFELQPGFNIEITIVEDKIYATATGQGAAQMFAEEKDKFFLKIVEADVHFTRDEEGKVKSLTLFQDGLKMVGKKVD